MGANAILDHLHTIYAGTGELVSAIRALKANPSPRDRARHLVTAAHHNDGLVRALKTAPITSEMQYRRDPESATPYPEDVWEMLLPYIMGDGYDVYTEMERATAVVRLLELVEDSPKTKRHPNQPSRDRQDDILSAIRSAKTPLTRPELMEAMKMKSEGKLGHQLAWMVSNDILINIPLRGYWPAGESRPV